MPSSPARKLLEDIVPVYHEVLLNEIAVMRSNTIVERGVDTGDAIVYYAPSYPFVMAPNANRGLDYIVLAYSIINGIRRKVCGYDVLEPINPRPHIDGYACSQDKIRDYLVNLLKRMSLEAGIEGIKELPNSLEELLALFVIKLIDLKLLFIFPREAADNINLVELLGKTGGLSGRQGVSVDSIDREFHSLRVLANIEFYLREYGVDSHRLVEDFRKRLSSVLGELSIDVENLVFKTLHGVLYKYSSTASSLPLNPATLESNILPFLIEPPTPIGYLEAGYGRRSLLEPELLNTIKEYAETIASSNNTSREKASRAYKVLEEFLRKVSEKYKRISEHQYRYLLEMFRRRRGEKGFLAPISSPTGSGKTLIFILYSIINIIVNKLLGTPRKAFIIYPRKALARDQLGRIIELVGFANEVLEQQGLSESKIIVGIRDGDSLKITIDTKKTKSLRSLKLHNKNLCHAVVGGKYIVFLADNPCEEVEPSTVSKERIIEWIRDIKREPGEWGYMRDYDILITNHSIIYMLVNDIFAENDLEKSLGLVKDIAVLVIDEAHVYIKENLDVIATALVKLLYLKAYARRKTPSLSLEDLVDDMDIILSSATLTDQQMVNRGGQSLYTGNIIGFFKLKTSCKNVQQVPSTLQEFLHNLVSQKIYEKYAEHAGIIYVDYDCTIMEDLEIKKENQAILWKYPFRVKTALVINPYPYKHSWTALGEVAITVLHWIHAMRSHMRQLDSNFEKSLAIVFIDSRETLRHVYRLLVERDILDALDHADRVLLTGHKPFDESQVGKKKRDQALNQIVEYINTKCGGKPTCSAFDLVYRDYILSGFNVLPFYFKLLDLKKLLEAKKLRNYEDFDRAISNLPSFNYIISLIGELNNSMKELHGRGYSKFIEKLDSTKSVLLMHHGKLSGEVRGIIESHMKGERTPIPLMVFATSTLELGVDIEHMPLVVQFSTEPSSVELAQRVGRSGRSIYSLYVAPLILVLRNTGEDLTYTMDQEAVEYIYNFIVPRTYNPHKYPDIIVRHLVNPYLKSCSNVNKDIECPFYNRISAFIKTLSNIGVIEDATELFEKWIFNVKRLSPLFSGSSLARNLYDKLREAVENIESAEEAFSVISSKIISYSVYLDAVAKTEINELKERMKKITDELEKIKNLLITSLETKITLGEKSRGKSLQLNALIAPRRIIELIDKIDLEASAINPLLIKLGLEKTLNEAITKLFHSIYELASYIDANYSVLRSAIGSSTSSGGRELEEMSISDFLDRKAYLFAALRPGMVDDIGNHLTNHVVVEYNVKKGRIILETNVGESCTSVFNDIAPLKIRVSGEE
jgi:ERCC4-related helicase